MNSGKELLDRFKHFCMRPDGTYDFPNSCEGDLLRMTHKYLTEQRPQEVAKARAEELETVIKELRNNWCFCTQHNSPCISCEIAQHLEAVALEAEPKAEKGVSDD